MLFSSMIFLWSFLPIVIVSNFRLKPEYSNILLLIASLVFYAWGEPLYVLLMLFSIVMNWLFGILISRASKQKTLLLAACIILNLSLLGYYKYFDFFAGIVNRLLGFERIPLAHIPLPIGISFFTFQIMSYIIDLYRGNCKVQRNILHLALYVSFFPQLIAGPIVRYSDIEKQLHTRKVTADKFALGLRRFIYGLGKKVILSNCMASIADHIFGLDFSELTTSVAWLGAIAYTLQIYYDFSGYSDMAIGLGKIFGFDFLENFKYPYLSRSIQEFWQRWHISLGTWFREYVYIPLGGNRKGLSRTYLNLFIVFFLTGMWHGASWNFIIWGLYHGMFQMIERLGFKHFLKKHNFVSHVYCLLIVVVGWVFFRAESLLSAVHYLLRMFLPWRYGFSPLLNISHMLTLRNCFFLTVAMIGSGLLQSIARAKTTCKGNWKFTWIELAYLSLILVYCFILLAAGTYNPFIYFRF